MNGVNCLQLCSTASLNQSRSHGHESHHYLRNTGLVKLLSVILDGSINTKDTSLG